MLSLYKYTVILSASQASATMSENVKAADDLQKYLEYCLYLEVGHAVGSYKGGEEISFVVHTNQLHLVQHLRHYATTYLSQECILVSHNRFDNIELQYRDRVETIGATFVPGKGDGENYTRIGGKYWSVA